MFDKYEVLIILGALVAFFVIPRVVRALKPKVSPTPPADPDGDGDEDLPSIDDLKTIVVEVGAAVREMRDVVSDALDSDSTVPADLEDTVPPIRVFVSSRQEELASERRIVADAVRTIPITRPWLFETSPSTSHPPREEYLSKVEECKIFILILGEDVSEPVVSEHDAACRMNRHRLYFVKSCERTKAAMEFLDALGSKVTYCRFSNERELHDAVVKSLWALLADSVRRDNNALGLAFADIAVLLTVAEHMKIDKDERVDDLRRITDDDSDERRHSFPDIKISKEDQKSIDEPSSKTMYCPAERRKRTFAEIYQGAGVQKKPGRLFPSDIGEVSVWRCSQCSTMLTNMPCLYCGHSPTVIEYRLLIFGWRNVCRRCGKSTRTRVHPDAQERLTKRD